MRIPTPTACALLSLLLAAPVARADEGALAAEGARARALRAAIDAALEDVPAVRLVRSRHTLAHLVGGAGACAPCPPKDPCAPPDPCASPWSLSFGLGASLAQGNSDKLDLSLDGKVRYERDPWLASVKALFAYGRSDGLTTTEALHVTGRAERKVGKRLYVFGQVDHDRDVPAGLVYRWTTAGGLGVTLVDGRTIHLKAEGGAGFTWERRTGRAATADPSAHLGLDYEKTWRSGATLGASLRFAPNLGDFDLSLATFESKLSVPLCAALSLSVNLRVDHVIDAPAPARDTDVLLSVGLRLTL